MELWTFENQFPVTAGDSGPSYSPSPETHPPVRYTKPGPVKSKTEIVKNDPDLWENVLATVQVGSEGEMCKGQERFYFYESRDLEPVKTKKDLIAKRLCGMCPIINKCLENSLLNKENYGTWGGMNESDRRKLIILIK